MGWTVTAFHQVKYVRQRKTDTYCLVYIWNMKKKSHKPKKVTHRKKKVRLAIIETKGWVRGN